MPAPNNFVALRAGVFVPAPVPGTHISIASVPGGNLIFGFNPSFALAIRPEDSYDLVLQLEHGGTVTLSGFFKSYDGTFPLLILPDGEVLAAIDFLRVFDLDMDTAAGPDLTPASGGLNEFADASGAGGLPELSGSRLGFAAERDDAAPDARPAALLALPAFVPRISIMPLLPETHSSGRENTSDVPAPVLFLPQAPGAPEAYPPAYTLDERGLSLTIDESLMPGGTNDANSGAPGYVVSFLVASNNGFASVTVGGAEYKVENGTLTGFIQADGANGHLSRPVVINQGGGLYLLSFVYTQGAPHGHGDGGKDLAADVDAMFITVSGFQGVSSITSVRVSVVDDVPLAFDDYRAMAETDAAVTGNVIAPTGAQILLGDTADASGYDGWAESPVTLLSTGQGAYGTLVMKADGSYTYTRNGQGVPDSGAMEVFTYRITDGDGDAHTATLTVALTNTPPTATHPGGEAVTVRLSDNAAADAPETRRLAVDLFDGPEAFTGAAFVNAPSYIAVTGLSVDTDLEWTLVNGVWHGAADGKILLAVALESIAEDGTVTVRATLSGPMRHAADADEISVTGFVVEAVDAGGSSVRNTIALSVSDSGPSAFPDVRDLSHDAASVSGNVLSDGGTADLSGADGWAATPVSLVGDGVGRYGTLVLDGDGGYTYTRNGKAPENGGLDEFRYKVTDADGDMAESTLTINLAGQPPEKELEPEADDPGDVPLSGASLLLYGGHNDYDDIVFGTFTGACRLPGQPVWGPDGSGDTAGAEESSLDDAMWHFTVLNAGRLEHALDSDDADVLSAIFGRNGYDALLDSRDGTLFQSVPENGLPAPDGSPGEDMTGFTPYFGRDGIGHTLARNSIATPEPAETNESIPPEACGHAPCSPSTDRPAWDTTDHPAGQDPAEQARTLIELVSTAGG